MTGVEDRLQDSVRPTLEMLRNAGIKVGVFLVAPDLSEMSFFGVLEVWDDPWTIVFMWAYVPEVYSHVEVKSKFGLSICCPVYNSPITCLVKSS